VRLDDVGAAEELGSLAAASFGAFRDGA